MPTLNEIQYKLQGGTIYSKVDCSDAFLQMEMDEESRKYCVINTPFGLYRYTRMPFGLAPNPAKF